MHTMCPRLIKIVLCTLMTGLLMHVGISRSLHVGSGHPYVSVKEGIAAADQGDTVIIHAGTYKEGNIIVDKTITLMGMDWPVLDGQLKYEVLSVKANNVVVTGLVVQNSGHASLDDPGGIKVYDSRGVHIIGNRLKDNFFGIYLQYSKHCIIKDNIVKASGTEEQQIGNGIHK